MAACDDAEVNIDWQFNVNTQAGDLKNESPLSAMSIFVAPGIVRYQPGQGLIYDSAGLDWALMETLVYGQRHNPPAQQSYRDCRVQSASLWRFWERVPRAAYGRPSDYGAAAVNIAWQRQANPESVANAHASWASASAVPEPDARTFFSITAMYYLLIGQRHSADAMQLYRACFRDDANRLFTLVSLVQTETPEAVLRNILSHHSQDGA